MTTIRQRIAALALVPMLMGAGALVFAQTAQARSTSCGSKSRHYSVRDGSIAVRIASIDLHGEACTNGVDIESSALAKELSQTSPGIAAGMITGLSQPYRTSFNGGGFAGGSFGYSIDGTNRACLSHWTAIFCSITETFRIHLHVTMRNALFTGARGRNEVVIHHRVFHFTWTWRCTNRACAIRLS